MELEFDVTAENYWRVQKTPEGAHMGVQRARSMTLRLLIGGWLDIEMPTHVRAFANPGATLIDTHREQPLLPAAGL